MAPTPAATAAPDPPASPWYINRRFALYWMGSVLSGFGDSVFEWTLALWAATVFGPDGAWLVVAILIASTGPALVFGPIAGVLVDQWRHKVRIVLAASIASGALTLLVIPLVTSGEGDQAGTGPVQVVAVLVVVVLASLIAQLFQPASGIIVRDIVPVEARERTAALFQVARSTTTLIAPAIAAPLLAGFGIGWALAINGVSFLVGAVFYRIATRGLAPDPEIQGAEGQSPATATLHSRVVSILTDLRAGLRFARDSPTVSTLLLALAFGFGGFGIWVALDVFFFQETLGGSTAAYGLLGTAHGAGELIGAVIIVRLVDRLGAGRLLWSGLTFVGVTIIGYALVTSVPAAIVACFVLGLGWPVINVVVGPMVLQVTPRPLLGRVLGTLNPVVSSALLIGAAVGGALYSLIGPTVWLGTWIGEVDTLRLLIGVCGVVVLTAALVVYRRLDSDRVREEQRLALGVDPVDPAKEVTPT